MMKKEICFMKNFILERKYGMNIIRLERKLM